MSKYWIFQDESGEPGKDPFFIVGILCMTEGQKANLLRSIRHIRTDMNYWNEFHFNKFSDLRAEIYKRVIQNAFTSHYITFRSIVVRKDLVNLKLFGNRRDIAYNKFTQLLVSSVIKYRTEDIHIRPDHKNRLKEDNFYEYLVNSLNEQAFFNGYRYIVKSCKSSDSKKCDLNQLCDLLTGVVKNRYSPAGLRKNEFATEMIRKFERKIHIWDWRPRKKTLTG